MLMQTAIMTKCIWLPQVYFDCGAKVDVVDVQGLILSPGFPYNYSSGIHCVWQFFVPVDYQLILEMFDFDVFESYDSVAQYTAAAASDSEEELAEDEKTPRALRRSWTAEDDAGADDADDDDNKDDEEEASLLKALIGQSEQVFSKDAQSSFADELQDVALQEKLMKIEVDQASESAKPLSDEGQPYLRATPSSPRLWIPVAQPPGDETPDSSISSAHPAPSPETPQPVLDACPHDVLYISDLITFSSRFCGSRRPPSSQLVFGSSQEMVEVIMELITTTHWGRGFALLFHYHNLTEPGGGEDSRTYARAAGHTDTLLAAMSGAVFFVMVLAGTVCVIFRSVGWGGLGWAGLAAGPTAAPGRPGPHLDVYFDCGAKVDVVDVQGLILSPGFPYNYSSGIHCVWQFFVPVDYQLILEMFDFDVFESYDSVAQYTAAAASDSEEELAEDEKTPRALRRSWTAEDDAGADDADDDDNKDDEEEASLLKALIGQSEQVFSKDAQSSFADELQDVALQEKLMKIEVDQASESAKPLSDEGQPYLRATPSSPRLWIPVAQPPGDETPDSSISSASPLPPPHWEACAPTQALVMKVPPPPLPPPSPHRLHQTPPPRAQRPRSPFCGSRRPPSSQLVFGSSQEMVEVIMELITTTHWGRGFALLFHYHNLTEPGGGEDSRTYARAAGHTDTLLAAISGAVFFVMVLAGTVCVIFRSVGWGGLGWAGLAAGPTAAPGRPGPHLDVGAFLSGRLRPKLCPKRTNSCVSSHSEVAEDVGLAAAEASELRVVTANEGEREELELSPGGLMELDLGADDVFITASDPSRPGPPLSAHARERYLRYSDTGPGPLSDWPLTAPAPAAVTTTTTTSSTSSSSSSSRGPTAARPEGGAGPARPRPRAWSTPPSLVPAAGGDKPQDDGRKVFSEAHLSKKPDAGTGPGSASSSASYPLIQTAQRQRRLNSTSNLRRSLFPAGACFGLLSGGADDPAATPSDDSAAQTPDSSSCSSSCSQPPPPLNNGGSSSRGEEADHVSVAVFAISEEEDREPLVAAEHLAQTSTTSLSPSPSMVNGLAGGSHRERRSPPAPPPPCQATSSSSSAPQWRPWTSRAEAGGGISSCHPFSPTLSGAITNANATATAEKPVVNGNSPLSQSDVEV
ncbi:hypothetical protein CRUP_011822 [Coryphaenoides rupestris]|nr:hypothetical protein CRUP_011822 [Coryphaenoides rupestris]